ncbi:MAG: ATP-binding protein [Myxococcales bacterium]
MSSSPMKVRETLACLNVARRALEDPEPLDHQIALDPAIPRCFDCKQPITDSPLVKQRGDGARIPFHGVCWGARQERVAQGRRDLEAHARARLSRLAGRLPRFAVRHDSPEFADRVRHPRLRALPARYRPELGSIQISSESGLGKTTAMAATCLQLQDDAVNAFRDSGGRDTSKIDCIARAHWTTASDLISARKQHKLGDGEAPEYARAETATLLFLDEIGQEIADDRWLLELLNVRYAAGLSTLSTSGLSPAALEQRYGSGARRRLIEPRGLSVDLFQDAGKPRLVVANRGG